jgi:hypothetical protein
LLPFFAASIPAYRAQHARTARGGTEKRRSASCWLLMFSIETEGPQPNRPTGKCTKWMGSRENSDYRGRRDRGRTWDARSLTCCRRYSRCLEARSARTQPAGSARCGRGAARAAAWHCGGQDALCLPGPVAQFERDVLRERTVAGMKAAKKRGIHVGRLGRSRVHVLPELGECLPQANRKLRPHAFCACPGDDSTCAISLARHRCAARFVNYCAPAKRACRRRPSAIT